MTDVNSVKILGISIDKVDMKSAVNKVESFLEGDSTKAIFTPNTEMIMTATKEKALMEVINQGDLVVPDGIGVVYASRRYKDPLPERVAGFDLMMATLEILHNRREGVFLLGGRPGVAERAAQTISVRFPGIDIKGSYHGYFRDEEDGQLVDKINMAAPDVLLVALGSPRQEKWIFKYKDRLNAKVAMGVGGSFDVLAGEAKRAPVSFQRLGLEWFYRLITQPWRAKRMMVLPVFVFRVLLDMPRRHVNERK